MGKGIAESKPVLAYFTKSCILATSATCLEGVSFLMSSWKALPARARARAPARARARARSVTYAARLALGALRNSEPSRGYSPFPKKEVPVR